MQMKRPQCVSDDIMADREDVTMLRNVPRSSEVAGDTGLPRESILATASALEAAAATDDEAADAQHKFIWQSVGLACGHTLSASTLTVANKWALEVYPYATTVTGLQVAFTILVVLVIKLSGCYPVDKLEFAKAWHYFPAASMFFLTMVAGNMVIAYASVQVFVVMRAVIPAVTFALDWLLLGGPKPTCTSYAWLCVMIGGGGMFFTQNTEPLTWPAIAWALVFLAIMPIDSLLVKKALTDIEFETWGRVYYQNLLALMMYLPMSLLTGEMSEALQLGSIASEPDVLLPLAVTCVLGLSISFFQLNLRNVIRATTFTLLGVLNKVLSVILDAFTTAQTPISITAIVGIVIMIIGGVGWTCVLGVKGVLTIKKQADNIEVYTGPPKWVSYYNGGFVVVTLLSLFTGPIIPAGPAPPPPPGTYPSALLNATSVAESGHCVRVTPSEPNGTYLDSIKSDPKKRGSSRPSCTTNLSAPSLSPSDCEMFCLSAVGSTTWALCRGRCHTAIGFRTGRRPPTTHCWSSMLKPALPS